MSGIGEVLAAAKDGTLSLMPLVITDWRDGPIEGITRLSTGDVMWIFKMVAEGALADDRSERLFLLSGPLDNSAASWLSRRVADTRAPLVWPFDDQPDSVSVESAIDGLLESAVPTALIVSSADFDVVLQAWSVESGFRPGFE